MLLNHIKLSIRSLLVQKSNSIINIIGLSVGIAAFLLIFLFIQYELGYNSYIPNSSQLYRCVEIQQAPGVGEQHVAVTMGPLGVALEKDFPEIENSIRMLYWGDRPIEYENQIYDQEYVVYIEPSVFDLFGVKLLRGDTATALKEVNSIVISEKVANKIFGGVDESMGKLVNINDQSFNVSAVMENQPEQSSVRMEALVPFEHMLSRVTWLDGWSSNSIDTYVKLKEGVDLEDLTSKFPEFINNYTDNEESDYPWSLYLQPVNDIHLESGHIKFQVMNNKQGSLGLVYAFIIIAVLIILLACINFINISIAQSVKRSKEVGMRKVMGAEPMTLVKQFLGESAMLTLISVLISLILVYLLLPFFNDILSVDLTIDFINNWIFNIGLLGVLVFVSLIAGMYPAFYLSRFEPMKVLKSRIDVKGSSSEWLTKGLVVFQFIISIGMIFSISVIYDQFNYAVNKDMGINYSNVISVKLYNKNDTESVDFLKNKFVQNPNVLGVSFVSDVNGVDGTQGSITVDDTTETRVSMRYGFVDYNFFEMMEIPIIHGRNFNKDYAFDDSSAVIINRAAAEYLKWDDPINKQFEPFLDTVTNMKVIGVIEDYNYYSIHSKIEPAIYMINNERCYNLAVKINGVNQEETIAYMEEIWNSHFPGLPFSYYVATERVKSEYKGVASTFKIFSIFTILSLVISCLGLYGLTSLVVERKNREIGIRKVFGGSVYQIVKSLISNFIYLVIIAGVIATPITWYLMNSALDTFAYHISITWIYAFEAISLAVIIAAATIIYHAVRAAIANPVETLRYE